MKISRNKISSFWLLFFFAFLAACQNAPHLQHEKDAQASPNDYVSFARGFDVIIHQGFAEVVIFNPWHRADTLKHFFVIKQADTLPLRVEKKTVLRVPLKRIIALSATQWGPLIELGHIGSIVGVSEGRFINDSLIRQQLKAGKVTDVGGESHYDVEKMLTLEADAVLYSPNTAGVPAELSYSLMTLIPWADYFENHPLGRAEWIKLLGLLVGEEERAFQVFNQIAVEYQELKLLAASAQERPTVFSDKAFAGQWYVPCGQSYLARMLADAGSDYIFSALEGEASVPLDIEAIFSKAAHARFWRIAQAAPEAYSYKQLLAENEFYGGFDAFKNHRIIFCNTAATAYFERGSLEPQKMLADLIAIFHPQLLPEHKARYYQLLEP